MKPISNITLVVCLAVGCRLADGQTVGLPITDLTDASAAREQDEGSGVRPNAGGVLLQPSAVDDQAAASVTAAEPLPAVTSPGSNQLSPDELVRLALSSNPAIGQAAARVEALRGRWVQVGLPPNPTAGYVGGEIGNEGEAGQQGGYVGQEFITGGKLQLNRAVLAQEIEQAEQRFAAMRLRVETDVRRAYYAALIAQRRIELAEELMRVSSQATKASEELLAAEEIPRAALLQTQVEQQSFAILVQRAINERNAAWQQLSAVTGSELVPRPLAGDVSQLPSMLDWSEQLVRVTTTSPEVAAAVAQVARAQAALRRACVEPIPDVSTQVSVQYDNATEDTIAGVQVGIPLPIWNRNQGGIRQARSEVTEARRNAERIELNLKRRLALAYQQYADARVQAEAYATQILPKAQETYELVQRGYRLGELGYLDFLAAQRIYSQTNLAYLEALSALWASSTEIDGLLLSGSLETDFD